MDGSWQEQSLLNMRPVFDIEQLIPGPRERISKEQKAQRRWIWHVDAKH